MGAEFFRAMARAYIAVEKPRDALLIRYGASFPAFVARSSSRRATLAYLPDVARLENAWVESYHAAEAPALTLAALAELPGERLAEAKVTFHPSARLLRSSPPRGFDLGGASGRGRTAAAGALGRRGCADRAPGSADVSTRVLPDGGYDFAQKLLAGETIAAAAANVEAEGFDPGAHFVGLIEAGALAAVML